MQSTDNVIELVIDKVQRLSPTNRYVLQLAACIGHQFDLQTLATISEKPPPTVATELWEAMQEGLILPIGDEYKYLPFEQATSYQQSVIEIAQDSPTTADLTSDIFYKFTHDRVQQAVYSLISEADKKHCHGKIGRLLLAVIPPEQLEERVFEVIDHLNIGAEMMVESDAKIELARLNLIAGQKAKTSVAYESALNYLSMGLSLLPGDRWQKDYKLTLALTELAAEVSYLTGDFEQMEQLAEQVLRHAQTDLDKTNVYLVKIQACIAQNRLLDAIRTALQALELLGTKLPEKPSRFEVLQGLIRTKLALAGRQIENLVNLPRMTDPYKLAVMRVIASVCTPTYFLVPELWQLMVFQKIQLSVKYGNAPGSAFGYADYGMILCGVEQNIKAGYRFSQLASTLQSQLNAREFIPKTTLLVNMYLKHWQEHLRETVNPLLEAYQRGLETGDLEYGTFAIAYRFYHSYLLGRELLQLEQEMSSYERAIAQFKQILPLNLTRIYHQAILNLMGQSEDPCQLTGKSYNEDESLPQHLAADDRYTVFNLYFNKLILSYLFQNTAQATEYAQKTEQLLAEGAVGLLVVPAFYFYHSLAQIAVFPEANQTQQVQILRSVTANQKKIKRWAEHAPMNYLHKFYLVEAEQHRILGQDTEAGEKYDRAIAIAKEQEYQNEEALAHELAGRFYLAKGKTLIAQAYLRAAHYGYLKWGASAKVSQLEHCYPQFFGLSQQTSSVSLSGSLTSSPTTTSRTGAEILDLAAIMKASQALSDEIVLDKLLAKLMMILIENAGADRGCLLLETQGKWQVRAEGNVNSGSITVYQRIEQEISHNASMAIVNYVARTQESVVLNHAAEETRFGQDAYIQQHQPKSILCTPLVYQGKLSGVLYLENNLTTDAFTAERLEILQLLSGQAAISIDNARLYSELELRVQERTTELIQMNERLKQLTTELQRSNQDLEQFAYIASHDLQEPLRAIISYTQMLAKKYQGKLDEKADLYIHFAVDGAVRMQQLIRDLLAYSRAGRQDLKRQPTDCNLVIQKVLQDLQVAIAESNATITTDPLPTLNADPNQLFLLFQNLIGNAIKYRGEEPPQIDVSATSLQKLDNQEEPDTWLFSIRDNGIGIEPQYCDRIFGIFQRLHTQEEYSGTGLGLAISQKIVERHGGRIWVESQAGQGSTFYIEIPAWEK
ncbi:MAG: GAF domain-containing protein [Leptolyngbyaceae cyanobacterium HOT.MB2.61]|nr:GAF domain-containing protein [Leptolyngbyaceae cyanobacterium HOT.MB2.61]